MSFNIAVAGKGGSGKTTVASLIIRCLIDKGLGPVLAVDADPNSNLAESFGVVSPKTIGDVLADFISKKIGIPPGMTKESYLELQLSSSIEERKSLDFLVMGRKQGPGCYCYPNVLLKGFIERLSGNYPYVVIDNEAGMEHLSRGNVDRLDLFALVADHSVSSLRAARRASDLAVEMKLNTEKRILIVNRYDASKEKMLASMVAETGITSVFRVEYDLELENADYKNISMLKLSENTPALQAVSGILNGTIGFTGRCDN